jgi:hypothetical protein
MLNRYAKKLPTECPRRSDENFLTEEMRVLEETMGISLPQLPAKIGVPCQDLVNEVWEYVEDLVMKVLLQYVEDLVMKVLLQHSENFPRVQSSCRCAIQSLMECSLMEKM